MALALRAVNALWQRDPAAWTVDRDNMLNSKLDVSQLKTGIVQRRHAQSRKEPETAQCAAYVQLKKTNVTTWWRKVRHSKTPPTRKHTLFSEHVIERCHTEQQELQKWYVPKAVPGSKKLSEPSRTALLGIPGAGKSLC